MEKPRNQWRIEKRIGIFRMTSKKKNVPRRKLVVLPALAGHRVGPKHAKLKLDVALEGNGRTPIPKSSSDGPVWSASDNRRNKK
jgi:hypothetical protein